MINSVNKGVAAAETKKPPIGVYGDVDLRVVPSYLSYKAATLRSMVNYKYLIGLIVLCWLATFIVQNNRVDYWQSKFREKEFILVPSKIVGHTPAVPQTVPKVYITSAIKSFIQMVGTTTPTGIRDQLSRFASYLEPKLGSKFLAESMDWIELTEKKGIYEQVEITRLEFPYNKSGIFKVKANLRRDRRENSQFLGTANEVITMTLVVQQPKEGQEWTFQITEFSRKPN